MKDRRTRFATLAAGGLVAVGAISVGGHVAQADDEVGVHYGDNHASLYDRKGRYSRLKVCDEEWDGNSVYAYVDINGENLYYDTTGDDGHCNTYDVSNEYMWRLVLCEDDWGFDTCVSADL